MKKFVLYLKLLSGVLLLVGVVNAQEVRWSQYYTVMPTINPASTGAFAGDFRAMANYRMSQYSGSADPFTTMYVSYDQGIKKYEDDGSAKKTFFAFGISFMSDKAGIGALTSQEVGAMFSFNLKISKHSFLSVGAKAAFGTRSVDYSSFKWSSQFDRGDGSYDPSLPTDPLTKYDKVNYIPISTGLMWNYSDLKMLKINAGLGLNRLNEPNVAFDANKTEKLPMQISGNLGADWMIPNSIVSLMPLILYQSQAYYSEINFGLFAKWNLSFDSKMTHLKKTSILYTGLTYRTTGDLILATKFDLRRGLAVGLSYDMGLGSDEVRGRSALEFVLTYSGFFMEKSMLPHKANTEFF